MTAPLDHNDVMRDAIALIHAAFRDDPETVEALIAAIPAESTVPLVVACATFAAGMCRTLAELHPGHDFNAALRTYAFQLADPTTTT